MRCSAGTQSRNVGSFRLCTSLKEEVVCPARAYSQLRVHIHTGYNRITKSAILKCSFRFEVVFYVGFYFVWVNIWPRSFSC
jgi:hypothetical protein